ncbi:hypothetical protein SAMN05421819_2272 [Bryocella elongata]|uniref:TonB-dependent receptor-like beta-barrel domain-containing protein n=1 Tax=Bryocella elongata TaxID=863522 RepID=A0A1H5YGL5_9BACT|nr:TonB-dependent receptor [Bryocella elongata]SEG22536.1 hypothetical protein SAMN05421819_2272 [Bryocella elongata]
MRYWKIAILAGIALQAPWQGVAPVMAQAPAGPAAEAPPPVGPQQLPRVTHTESVTVTASTEKVDVLAPNPSEQVYLSEDLLEANPGRPGVPVSIPGYPAETASGGIKAPQYFAPGVAGDHGEPIAQYIAVGAYLLPNNLSANAHGNGYADPNILIPSTLESVAVDAGAFNVLEGNHAVDLAATYAVQPRLAPHALLLADLHDADLSAGFSPRPEAWLALEVAAGNGLLRRLEHRQQYKLNGQRIWRVSTHTLTLLGIAYFGQSYVPGLVPLYSVSTSASTAAFRAADTVDPRQHDQTHTAILAAADTWQLTARQQINLGGFFRTYNLSLFSNFGAGLIRQSEFRTAQGTTANWREQLTPSLELMGGMDFHREAPRRDNLDSYGAYTGSAALGSFTKVDSSDITITTLAPYGAAAGSLGQHVRYYAGWRRDQIDITNDDLMHATNSFSRWVGVNSPKATVAVLPPRYGPLRWLPELAASGGEAFFTEDPRVGMGTTPGSGQGTARSPNPATLVARSHSYQLVASKGFAKTELRLVLGHTTNATELAKIDPDTGLQEDQGPSRLRFLTATVRQGFRTGWLLLTFSKADARTTDDGLPVPEAPRTIADATGALDRLPLGLRLQAEFEYVGAKPLGTGCSSSTTVECVGVPVTEFRLGLARSFLAERLLLGINAMVANGYTGQTTEAITPSPFQQIVGVRMPSYVSADVRWRLGR